MTKLYFVFIGVCVFAGVFGHACYADILHVPGAYANLTGAVYYAEEGDTVLIADGVYTGSGFCNGDFRPDNC